MKGDWFDEKRSVDDSGCFTAGQSLQQRCESGEHSFYLISQLSCELSTGKLIGGSIEEQTRRALENIRYLLEHADSSMDQVVDVTIFMKRLADFRRMDTVYRQFFKPGEEPARVTVRAESPVPGIDIEIKITALCGE